MSEGIHLRHASVIASNLLAFGFCYRFAIMHTLVLRKVPDEIYRRLKESAAAHHRSMTQEAILSLGAALDVKEAPPRPTPQDTLAWLEKEVWALPVQDTRSSDEILGYGDDGLCH